MKITNRDVDFFGFGFLTALALDALFKYYVIPKVVELLLP